MIGLVVSLGPGSSLVTPQTARAQTGGGRLVERELYVRIQPGNDTFLVQSAPNENRGANPRLRAGAYVGAHFHSVLEFSLPELPAGATLSQAQLTVYNNVEDSFDPQRNVFAYDTLTAYRMTQPNWAANRATWRTYDGVNRWQQDGGDVDSSALMRAPFGQGISDNEYTYRRAANIRPLVEDALNNRNRRLLVLLEGPHKQAPPDMEMHSSESDQERWRPLVRISYLIQEEQIACDSPAAQIDVMVAMDHSLSMANRVGNTGLRRLDAAKNAIKNSMLQVFGDANSRSPDRIRVGLVGIAYREQLFQSLTSDFGAYRRSLDGVEIPGQSGTVIGRGINLAKDELLSGQGNRSNVRKVMIVLSDGMERGDLSHPVAASDLARQRGIEMYSISIGTEGIMPLIYSFPRSTHYYFDRDGSQFDHIFRTIAEDVNRRCQEHNLKFCVRDASDPQADPMRKRPVAGARVDIADQFFRSGLTPPDDQGYLISGSDGCTNPTYLNYPALIQVKDTDQTADVTHSRFVPLSGFTWRFQDTFDPQVVIILLEPIDTIGLKFCVRDSGNNSLIPGAHVEPNTPSNTLIRTDLSPPDDQGFLITGPDGCTNPDFIDENNLHKGDRHTARAAAEGYADGTRNWGVRGSGFQVVEIFLTPDTRVDIDAVVSKSALPDVLVGTQRDTRVTITFAVEGVANEVLRNVVVREKLTNDFRLAANPNFQLSVGSIDRIDRISNQLADVYLAGEVAVGVYQLSFNVVYGGGFRENIPIDRFDATRPDRCDQLVNLAHISYLGTSGTTRCRQIDPGNIESRPPRLILIDDAWIGNKQVTVGDTLQVGRNSLIVSGSEISGSGFIGVDNYTLPSTGRLAWKRLVDLLGQRVDRSAAARAAQTWRCPSTEINGVLYLNGKTSPQDPETEGSRKVWKLENCRLRLGNVTFVGTGTILNTGGNLELNGRVAPEATNPDATFGYMSLAQGSSDARVILASAAEAVNMAIFAGNTIEIQANTSIVARKHAVKLIGRIMEFPRAAALKADIEVRNANGVTKNPPPLFEQPFDRPSGREVP